MSLKFIRRIFCFSLILSLPSVCFAALPELTSLVNKASPAVVKVFAYNGGGVASESRDQGELPQAFRHLFGEPARGHGSQVSLGSGFFISSDGYLVTNFHVIKSATKIEVKLADRREFSAVLVGADASTDLALLKVDEKKMPYLRFSPSDKIKVGEWVVAIGVPFGLDFSVSAGIVSGLGRSIPSADQENYVPYIQTDLAINPGNSGGPLINMDGEVVGVNAQIFSHSGASIGLSFAIPSQLVMHVVAQLKERGFVIRGWLGAAVQDLNSRLSAAFKIKRTTGALVTDLIKGGPADAAGLKIGDIIVKFGDKSIKASNDLPHTVGMFVPKTVTELVIYRSGKRQSLSVTIGEKNKLKSAESNLNVEMPTANRLGVQLRDLTPVEREKWGVSSGVQVVFVDQPNGERGDIMVGDLITHIGSNEVENKATVDALLAELPPDTTLALRTLRGGQIRFVAYEINE